VSSENMSCVQNDVWVVTAAPALLAPQASPLAPLWPRYQVHVQRAGLMYETHQ
jgi:hypothetical protein